MTRARAHAAFCVVVTAAVLGASRPAQASLTQLTQSTHLFSNPTVIKFDAAYDPTNKVYLVVWGKTQPGPITGIFLNAQGQPISGGFDLSVFNGYTSGWARVVYGAQSGFMVTYTKSFGNPVSAVTLYARFLRYSTNGPVYGSGEVEIQQLGANHPGSDDGLAYVSSTGGYIAGFWMNPAFPQSYIKGVSPNGATPAVPVTDGTDGYSDPEVSCDPGSNRCLVVGFSWGSPFIVGGKYTGASWGRLIDATTLQPIGTTNTYISGGARAENQGVAFSAAANQFVVGWVQGYDEIIGRSVDPNWGMGAPYIIRTGSGTTNGNDCSFGYGQLNHAIVANNGTGTLAAAAVDWCGRAWIQELNANGTPTADFKLVDGLVTIENNPVVVANHEDKQYLFLHNYQVAAPRSVLYGATGPGGGGNPPGQPPPPTPEVIDLSTSAAPNDSWFFAEGAESGTPTGFHTFYLIANENDVPVTVRAFFANDSGVVARRQFNVAANSRTTVSLGDVVGAGAFGAVFQSVTTGADIFVERSMYWGPNLEGSTGATGVKTLSTQWLFAEGSRGGEYFSNFFLLLNPNRTETTAFLRFFLANGTTVDRSYTLPAQSRRTINANDIPQLAGQDFSTSITTNHAVVAERAMYWGPSWIGGTATLGATNSSPTWYFAEGAASPGFETFYLIQNPNPVGVTIYASFYRESGAPITRVYDVAANSRFTVYLNGELGNIGGVAAAFASSSLPVVMERATYWGAGRVEGTVSVGASAAAYDWHLPEGTAGGAFDTFMLMANPTPYTVTADVILYVEGVGRFTAPAHLRPVLAPYSRKTIYMNDYLAQVGAASGGYNLTGKSFSTRVTVVGNVAPIVVEHVLYWQRDGANYWRSGSGSFGIAR